MDMDMDCDVPTPPLNIPLELIADLHDTIIRTRDTLKDCDKQLDQLQGTLGAYLVYGDDGTSLGGAIELSEDVLRDWFDGVMQFMPLVAKVEDKEDKLVKLLEATREVVGCLLATLRWAGGRGMKGRGNVCIV